MSKTINDFIKELQQISPDKRELPLVIAAENGMVFPPKIKMLEETPGDIMMGIGPTKMIITY